MKIKKITLLAILASLTLTGCGASSTYDNSYGITSNSMAADSYKGGAYSESYDYITDDDYATESSSQVSNTNNNESKTKYEQKLIYTCNISLETLNYSDTVRDIKKRISDFNGFIESESEYSTNYNWYNQDSSGTMHVRLTVRVPSEKYDDFINSLEGDGKILSKVSNVENITKSYYETSALIDSLKIQEQRLLSMLDVADTIDDMITVERRLTEVQSQLNVYNTRLATYDMDVDYSVVNLNIDEVEVYTPVVKTSTFFDRLKNTIKDSWESFWNILEGLLFFIIRLVPITVIFVPIITLIVKIMKKIKKRRKTVNKNENK